MPEPIKASWCLSDNFGDKLTPWLIKKITGRYPLYLEPGIQDDPKLLGAGSILNWNWAKNPKLIVWGSGIAAQTDSIEMSDFRLVRGPICSERIKQLYKIDIPFGDPGLLLSRFINKNVTQTDEIGIIPHYADQLIIWKRIASKPKLRFINILNDIEDVVSSVRSCKFIFSSSLHGLILADCYHIPNYWIKVSNNLLGDDTKFRDYFLSVNRNFDCIDCRDQRIPYDDVSKFTEFYNIRNPIDKIEARKEIIWNTCPFVDGILK